MRAGRRRVLAMAGAGVLTAGLLAVVPSAAYSTVRLDVTLPPTPAPAVLDPIDLSAGTAPTPAGVRKAVGGLIGSSLGDSSVVIMDPATGTLLLERRPGRPRIPASTAKLATAAAALDVLGPEARIPTVVSRDGDTLYLVGEGTPRWCAPAAATPCSVGARRSGNWPGRRPAGSWRTRRSAWSTTTPPSAVRCSVPAGALATPRRGWRRRSRPSSSTVGG